VSGPLGALQWIARQVAEQALQQMLDPARIEQALRLLERRLDNGEITEDEFEAEESRLLDELMQMRAIQSGAATEEPADAA
jgi:predicted Zn-dependent peptidase